MTSIYLPTAVAEAALETPEEFGKLEIAAYKRHLFDIARQGLTTFPYYFDDNAAMKPSLFSARLCRHSKGEWAGQPMELQPWEQFIFGSMFGWRKKSDHTRRYRVAYIEVPRKNGKTSLCAVAGPLLAFFDDEPGAEVYCVATKRDQAKILFDEAARMVRASPEMSDLIEVLKNNMNDGVSKMEPLGRDSKTQDGLNVHGCLIDEIHKHRNSEMIDVMQSASGARRQPMRIEITTAGTYEPTSVCWQHHEYSIRILEAAENESTAFVDDTWFAFIAAADEGDDWTEPRTWKKANPNWGVSVKEDYIATECERAKKMPSEQNVFGQMHLNRWPQQQQRAIDMRLWMKCKDRTPLADLLGRRCWAGLDLASTMDQNAFALVFPSIEPGDDSVDVLVWYWMPEEGILEKQRKHMARYTVWADEGHLILTPGIVADYDRIRADIRDICAKYSPEEIAYDPWNQAQIVPKMIDDGANMVPFRQGFGSMNTPCKEILRLVTCGRFRHGGHPVLHWNASNVQARYDEAQNMKWDRRLVHTQKIDGLVAGTMALGRLMAALTDRKLVTEQQGGIRVIEMG